MRAKLNLWAYLREKEQAEIKGKVETAGVTIVLERTTAIPITVITTTTQEIPVEGMIAMVIGGMTDGGMTAVEMIGEVMTDGRDLPDAPTTDLLFVNHAEEMTIEKDRGGSPQITAALVLRGLDEI